ncbi:MAG: amidohydrolase [Bacteroidales bacterium]|nr:amidohydrolase [Bacteroidales bacterium]
MKISVLQLDTFWHDKKRNIDCVDRLIAQNLGSDIYVLPEMFATGFSNEVVKLGECIDGETVASLKYMAAKYDAAICGSMILHDDGKYYNSFVFVTPQAEVFHYEKRHLFGFGGETDMFESGKNRVIVDYKGFRILLQVCYDLRFPVWSRNRNDYDIIFYVANWPKTRQFAFDTLLRARAIENQAFVVGVNRVGTDALGLEYDGGSCIIDFRGETLVKCSDGQNVITEEISKNDLVAFREGFPAWKDADSFKII